MTLTVMSLLRPDISHAVRAIPVLCGMSLFFAGCVGRISGPHAEGAADSAVMQGDSVPASSVPNNNDLTLESWRMADSVMRYMTLEERVGQCLMPSVYANADGATMARLRSYVGEWHVGGVLLLKGTLEGAVTVADTLASLCAPAGAFVAIDAEWGLGMRLADAPVYPTNSQISATADDVSMFDYGMEVARQCRMAGVNMVLGPVADVAPAGSVMARRSFGPDASRVAELSVAYARGLEHGGVLSVAKHFPGHGDAGADSHRTVAVLDHDVATINDVDLVPFKSYIDQGLSGIMAGHIAVAALDSTMRPAAVSPQVLKGLLREKLGFKGLVLTDALNMGGAQGYTAADAIAAGADIVVAPADTRRELRNIMEAVREGRVSVADIDDRCRRILFYKYLVMRGQRRPSSL